MKEQYENELSKLIVEYERKHDGLDKNNKNDGEKLCIKNNQYDKLNKWFLEEKNKLIKKYNKSIQ